MHTRTLSLRDLAKSTGLSKATVANALNGSPTVAAATRKRVLAAADALGYKRNPLIGALMSAMRRARRTEFQGVLAAVELMEPDRPRHGPFHLELVRGCKDASLELGFKLDFFQVSAARASTKRLNSILKARGIRGLIVLPAWRTPDFTKFDWSFFTGVYTDYITDNPVLNTVCCDHYRSIFELLKQLELRGYRRPGLVIENGRDERIHHRTIAALRSFQSSHAAVPPVAPLVTANLTRAAFARWLRDERPDVVLSHDANEIDWIRSSGFRVPEDVGYVSLNRAKAALPCAALDLHPDQIGRSSVEILIGQIQRQAWGLPRFPTTTMIIAEFVSGDTLLNRANPLENCVPKRCRSR